MAAAVEQSHDENGIVWPAAIAPYDVHVLSLDGGAIEVVARAEEVAETLVKAASTFSSTTVTSAREKFADADLVGCPVRVIAGKKTLDDGAVDVRRRDGSVEDRVAVADVLKWVQHA